MSEREKEMKANREKDKGNEVCCEKCLSLLSDSVTCMYSCKLEKKISDSGHWCDLSVQNHLSGM